MINERGQGIRRFSWGATQRHLSWCSATVELCRAEHRGLFPAQVIEKAGLLETRAALANGVYLSNKELKMLHEREIAVVHNLASNLKLGSGIAPLNRLREEGLSLALGTDGPGSNDSVDLFKDLRLAALLHRIP